MRASEDGWNMFEWKADRRSIGGYFDAGPFTEQRLQLQPNEVVFLFSDGYGDQFGGEKDKELGRARMREVLLKAVASNNLSSMNDFYLKWKADGEQVDDVTVVALKC